MLVYNSQILLRIFHPLAVDFREHKLHFDLFFNRISNKATVGGGIKNYHVI